MGDCRVGSSELAANLPSVSPRGAEQGRRARDQPLGRVLGPSIGAVATGSGRVLEMAGELLDRLLADRIKK
jgi:hypothetical protein